MALFRQREKAVARAGIIAYTIMTVIWLWAVLSFREPAGDPWRYMLGLNYIAKFSFVELLSYDRTPFGFALLNWITSLISTNSVFFFSVIYAFCIIPLYLAFRERANKTDAAVLMMLYLLYPFYINYLASGFKQGIAFGFMLWGLNCILDRADPKWIKGLLLLFLATLFHSSFWLVNVVFASWYFIYRRISLQWSFFTLGICIFIAAIGVSEFIITKILPGSIVEALGFSSYFDQEFLASDEYLSVGYKSGFRIDFAVFTIIPIFIISYLKKNIKENFYMINMMKFYCIVASVYFIFIFIPYSDRIAGFSWFLIPSLLYNQFGFFDFKKYKEYLVVFIISSYPILMLVYTKGYFQ